ncbi:PP0621 family protein [Burkholderiales bacterium]|nr:PP0621 family protein [Burkholderiales bacterium]
MLKYLLLFVVIVLAYAFVKTKARKLDKTSSNKDYSTPAVEDMARCAHCGVHFPLNEGVRSGGLVFCSNEHRKEKDKSHR